LVTHKELETSTPAVSGPTRRRRLLGVGILALLLALVAETIWFAPLAGDVPAAGRAPAPLPLAAVNPYGVNVFLNKEVDPWKKEKTLQMVQEAGAGWIKQQFPWAELEFKKDTFWDDRNAKSSWEKFDEIVNLADRYGLHVIARLDRPPAWARTPGSNPEAPPANNADFGDFVYAFVTHYKGRVQFLQIWNEPNLAREWYLEKPVDPAAYVALLKEATRRAHEADPNVMILAAPLATNNELPPSHNLNELRYLEQMYQAGAKDLFDIMAANAYGLNHPPEDPPDAAVLNFRRVELLRQVMEQHGDGGKAIWFNEYGWNAPDEALVPPNPTPGSTAPDAQNRRWGSVSLAEQADYTVRGIQYAREHWPWAGVFTIWYFRQVGDIPITRDEYYFQMVSPDWVKQPVYTRVQAAAQEIQVAGPGTYSALSAPVLASGGWSVVRDPEAVGGMTLATTVTSNTIRIRFHGTDLAVALGPQPGTGGGGNTPRLYVTVDGGTARVAASVPRDEQGRPYIDSPRVVTGLSATGAVSAAPVDSAEQVVPVVSGLESERPPGVHTVELTADGSGVTFAGFTVRSERSYLPFAATTLALVVALGILVAALRRGRHATMP
jgi:hypothetical protein